MNLKLLSLFSAAMALFAAPSRADAVCYERIYDTLHMKKHILQEVTKIRLLLDDDNELSGKIEAAFREGNAFHASSVDCVVKGNTTTCEILDGGGRFDFTKTDKGIRLVNTSSMRFGDDEGGISIGREAEHRVFLLFTTSINTCRN